MKNHMPRKLTRKEKILLDILGYEAKYFLRITKSEGHYEFIEITSSKVLTLDFINGKWITNIPAKAMHYKRQENMAELFSGFATILIILIATVAAIFERR